MWFWRPFQWDFRRVPLFRQPNSSGAALPASGVSVRASNRMTGIINQRIN